MSFDHEELYRRAEKLATLNWSIKCCQLCQGMNIPLITESSTGFGSPMAPAMLVGQSLCSDCMKTQIPFTHGSGRLIDEALEKYGLNRISDTFITNVVHCHPPGNRASSKEEIRNCRQYLVAEIAIVKPILLVALGADAKRELTRLGFKFSSSEGASRVNKVSWIEHDSKPVKFTVLVKHMRHPASFLYQPNKERQDEWVKTLGRAIKNAKKKQSR